MQANQSEEHGREKEAVSKGPITLPLFAVQLQNILPIEIVARRLPEELTSIAVSSAAPLNTNIQINIQEPAINIETRQAQVLMEITVVPSNEPHLFEITLKLVGLFTYASGYSPESVRQFLQQGSLSVLLPAARELLLSLCTRLQIPLIVLPLVQLAPPPTPDMKAEDITQ